MVVLGRELRKRLGDVVAEARNVAEKAAQKALNALAVSERDPHRGMSGEQKALRNRLRAHGRQLSDVRNTERGTQELDHLVAECAYEHWHRMLFARFLAENQLLIEPESGVAVALGEIKELARARAKDWVVLAGEFAVQMLPQVFRQDDPVLQVEFAPEDRKRLEGLVEALSPDVFTASDSLGWTYQFWQAERKDVINSSGKKIGAEELPAVTQLFTEDYMVDFLLDNTLGAWHAAKVLAANPRLAENATCEQDLRNHVALPGCPWTYLRFIKGKDARWSPAAGTFDGWATTAKEIECLDPCMGSGHFVVGLFERLVALRMAEESLDEATAVASVIRDNLFGLEIDPRCTQIAAFNLALAAWRHVGHRSLPAMNLACSGLAPNTRKVDWLAIAAGNQKLERGMERLHQLFQRAAVLGSLIDPRAGDGDLLMAAFDELEPLLDSVLAQETQDDAEHEMAVTARGLAKVAEILARQFTLVATNVPYLGRGKQDHVLQDYCSQVFPEAKSDLATCFVERSLAFCRPGGTTALVTPQNWLFLGSYKKLRQSLLRRRTWNAVARLGPNAFQDMNWWASTTVLTIISKNEPSVGGTIWGIDVSEDKRQTVKSAMLRGELSSTEGLSTQTSQLANPDARITVTVETVTQRLEQYASSYQGVSPADLYRYGRNFWEGSPTPVHWRTWQTTVDRSEPFAGREWMLSWDEGLKDAVQLGVAFVRGEDAWGKMGVVVNQMSSLAATLYTGGPFDTNAAAVIPHSPEHLAAIWCFCASPDFSQAVRRIDQAPKVTNASLVKVPFDLARWQKVAAEKYPQGLPKPFSSDPTQWLFNGRPEGADQSLHVAVARLLGYRWPRQTGSSFPESAPLGSDGLEKVTDEDGIVPINPVKGESSAAQRLGEFLASAYGKDWDATLQEELIAQVNYSGALLEDWLRNGFFDQHCALFHNRPFIWHIWDGERDGFHALVNYHSLAGPDGQGRKTLEKLTYSYLGDWIGRQKAEQRQGKEGADAKLTAALHLQEQLKKVIEGEPPYDLFVRWKPLRAQAIGWEPDINDGVRMNIRPFMLARTLNGKSIFRKSPKIKWEKDRGKEPERPKRDFPWLWSWDEQTQDFSGGLEFDGNRWNDLHYSSKTKQDARTRHDERGR